MPDITKCVIFQRDPCDLLNIEMVLILLTCVVVPNKILLKVRMLVDRIIVINLPSPFYWYPLR